ncbi:MAG: flagellar basal body L-ring protein FlgH [Pirellulales bacterium]
MLAQRARLKLPVMTQVYVDQFKNMNSMTPPMGFSRNHRSMTVRNFVVSITVLLSLAGSMAAEPASVQSPCSQPRPNSNDAVLSEIAELKRIASEIQQRLEKLENHYAARKFGVGDIITVTGRAGSYSNLKVAAQVVSIDPNGNLRIESQREIRHSNNITNTKITGVVRPASIDKPTRTVDTDEIYELRVNTITRRL